MTKSITKMTAVELAAMPKEKRINLFREALLNAIQQSIVHSNVSVAQPLIQLVPVIFGKSISKETLLEFLIQWGNFRYNKQTDRLLLNRKFKPGYWTPEVENQIRAAEIKPSKNPTSESKETKPSVVDAEKEFRVALDRVLRAIDDPEKTVLHPLLVKKVQEAIYSYGRSDAWDDENKRIRTLFDSSTQRSTVRASKYSKGC